MRQIGHIENETAARTFGDFLYVRGIDNQVEFEAGHGWVIWIKEEENVARARQLLAEFQANPDHPSFRAQAAGATEAREQARQEQEAYAARVKGSKQIFAPLYGYGFGPVTLTLTIICIVVAVISRMGDEPGKIMSLFITSYDPFRIEWYIGLPEIRHGQLWRLITPIFIHYGFLHIFFNLLWLRDLGGSLEGRYGSWLLLAQIIVIAIVSNLAQYALGGHPVFGGLSGVVYGLLGYIWIRGNQDPKFGLALPSSTLTMMIIWFALCWFGIIGHVANWAHTGGLVVGMAWGFLAALRNRNRE